MKLIIAALGVSGIGGMTVDAYEALRENHVIFRTAVHEAARQLIEKGISWETLDDLYDSQDDFDALDDAIAQKVIESLHEHGTVVYAVAGGAGFGDSSVPLVIKEAEKAGAEIKALPGCGYFEQAALLGGGMMNAFVCPALLLEKQMINTLYPLVITEINDVIQAGEVKLTLMERYPDDCRVTMIDGESRWVFPLHELDKQKKYSHSAIISLPPIDIKALSRYDFNRLLRIISILRGQDDDFEGCPWDMEQTHDSIKRDLVEEAYEAVEAIDSGDGFTMADELGDMLLQIVLHAQIGREEGEFDIDDITTAICEKMIYRHPHIFADANAETADDVLKAWDKLKLKEKKQDSVAQSMRDLPKAMPALMRAAKVQKRAANAGFDFTDALDAMKKLPEEIEEVKEAIKKGDQKDLEMELGDLLFAVVNVIRLLKVDAELSLNASSNKFIRRFEYLENAAQKLQKSVAELTFEESDAIWEEAKKALKDN
ncbi:MAG: nucleoside triphosphate pyrophosphohydrolase [Clostridia bacterium]|nr:nucleoside triphosphate pyrophosphohydrolase [Clostridia bacterium]